MCEGPSPNYKVQRPHAGRSARGRAATSRAGGSAARGRALYGDAARCKAELGDAAKTLDSFYWHVYIGDFLVLLNRRANVDVVEY
jgi:hypothetical protein